MAPKLEAMGPSVMVSGASASNATSHCKVLHWLSQIDCGLIYEEGIEAIQRRKMEEMQQAEKSIEVAFAGDLKVHPVVSIHTHE